MPSTSRSDSHPALAHLSSPPRSSPPIHRPHNKFFDTLTLADRPRSQQNMPGLLRGTSSSSVGSFGSLGGKEEWEEGKNGKVEDVMELQIAEENISRSAHYGYVVRLPSTCILVEYCELMVNSQYCLFVGRSNEQDVLISGCMYTPPTFAPDLVDPLRNSRRRTDQDLETDVIEIDAARYAGEYERCSAHYCRS